MIGVIPDRTFFRIGDVAKILGVKTYVIRFWETEFSFLAPEKGPSGQRVYKRSQIDSLILVKHLLHVERYSIEGAKKRITELRKAGTLKSVVRSLSASSPKEDAETSIGPGSVLPKSKVESLRSRIEELRSLIRDPKSAGMDVPGLKSLDSSSRLVSRAKS